MKIPGSIWMPMNPMNGCISKCLCIFTIASEAPANWPELSKRDFSAGGESSFHSEESFHRQCCPYLAFRHNPGIWFLPSFRYISLLSHPDFLLHFQERTLCISTFLSSPFQMQYILIKTVYILYLLQTM